MLIRKPILSPRLLITVSGLSLGILAMSSRAEAVSFNSAFGASRFDTVGTTFTNMTPVSTTFCYLSSVLVAETDTAAESSSCQVFNNGTVWVLAANLSTSSDADVICGATCYNN